MPPYSLFRQLTHDRLNTLNHAGHAGEVELVRGIRGQVVVRVPERRRVRDHQGHVILLPEGPVVGPADARNDGGQRGALRRELGVPTECADNAADQPAGAVVADESDEVALRGVEPARGSRRGR